MSFLFSWCSTGGLGPTAGCWLSLLHLISIFSGPQLIRAPGPFGLMWLSLPHLVYNTIRSSTQLPPPWASNSTGTRTQFNYIIVRRPLDLWNRMFNRHQAEITVKEFRGHSLPVHHSVVYPGNYPFHQPISAHAISSPNCHWNVSLHSGASPWNSIFWAGSKVKT